MKSNRQLYSNTVRAFLIISFTPLLMWSCTFNSRPNLENNGNQIQELIFEQQDKWNNGDLEGFMSYYWNDDSLCFLSKNGMNCGWENIYNGYKKGYGNKEKMGRLDFSILRSEPLNDTTHFLVGQWKVSRTSDTLGGSFNLIWRKVGGKWLIVFDHTS